jgi:hypothetical protein
MKCLRHFKTGRTGAEQSVRPLPDPREVRVGREKFIVLHHQALVPLLVYPFPKSSELQ